VLVAADIEIEVVGHIPDLRHSRFLLGLHSTAGAVPDVVVLGTGSQRRVRV
jgi:hypothetical protein